MVCRIKFSHLKRKSILSARWPQLGPGLIVWTYHRSARITHLAHRKSYLVIICPNSHENLTKSEIWSSSSRFEHCSESLI